MKTLSGQKAGQQMVLKLFLGRVILQRTLQYSSHRRTPAPSCFFLVTTWDQKGGYRRQRAFFVTSWDQMGAIVLFSLYNLGPNGGQATLQRHSPHLNPITKQLLQPLRNAGIKVPLMIDAPDCGQKLKTIGTLGSTFSLAAYRFGFHVSGG